MLTGHIDLTGNTLITWSAKRVGPCAVNRYQVHLEARSPEGTMQTVDFVLTANPSDHWQFVHMLLRKGQEVLQEAYTSGTV